MASPSPLVARLSKRKGRLRRERDRQLDLFDSTKRRGHARKAAQLGRKIRRIAVLISEAEKELRPRWKLELAARFIAPFEGLRTEAYQDSGGIWTIGYGHTGSDVFPGQVISTARAMALFVKDLRKFARGVEDLVTRPMTIRQKIAAISFGFNIGLGGLAESTFLREFNAGNDRAAGDALLLWVKDAAGNTLAGLERRRKAERWLILHPRKGETA